MSNDRDKFYLVSQRWNHHANHSGYDRLGLHIGRPLTSKPVPDYILPDRLYRRMIQEMPGYNRTSLALEIKGLMHMATHKGCLYHFLYGESGCRFLGNLNGWRDHKLVVTYHKPPQAYAEMMPKLDIVRRLSAVIVVGRNQIASFEGIMPNEHVYFVPYFVDTAFFTPPQDFKARENNLCLFVGAHLRDFQTLRGVIENAWVLTPEIEFAVVLHPLHLGKLNGVVGNYTIYSNIEETDLLNLYRKAALLIMPIKDTTTNTAVLEAMSCGLPMVVTDVGAIRDYVNEGCARFVSPFEPQEMLDSILALLNSSDRRKQMAEGARAHAMNFDMRTIAKRMEMVYKQIMDQGN